MATQADDLSIPESLRDRLDRLQSRACESAESDSYFAFWQASSGPSSSSRPT